MLHVAVGIVFNPNGEVLVAERDPEKHQGGRWEFPGGKVELNETVFNALKRELKEEVDIEVVTAESWWQMPYRYPDKVIVLDIWKVTEFTGTAHGIEGQAIQWVAADQLRELDIPDANHIIVERLLATL